MNQLYHSGKNAPVLIVTHPCSKNSP